MTELWDEGTFASVAKISKSYIQKMRVRGEGPPFLKVGTRVRYKPEDVQAWISSRPVFNSTSQMAA